MIQSKLIGKSLLRHYEQGHDDDIKNDTLYGDLE